MKPVVGQGSRDERSLVVEFAPSSGGVEQLSPIFAVKKGQTFRVVVGRVISRSEIDSNTYNGTIGIAFGPETGGDPTNVYGPIVASDCNEYQYTVVQASAFIAQGDGTMYVGYFLNSGPPCNNIPRAILYIEYTEPMS